MGRGWLTIPQDPHPVPTTQPGSGPSFPEHAIVMLTLCPPDPARPSSPEKGRSGLGPGPHVCSPCRWPWWTDRTGPSRGPWGGLQAGCWAGGWRCWRGWEHRGSVPSRAHSSGASKESCRMRSGDRGPAGGGGRGGGGSLIIHQPVMSECDLGRNQTRGKASCDAGRFV